ncbi:MAG: DMT family transporter [Hyphomicrobiales bacterium]
MATDHHARNGLFLMMAASVVDSTSGLFTRLIGADGFTLAAGRGFAAAFFLLLILVIRDGRKTWASLRSVGWAGAALVAFNAVGMVLNIMSLATTEVANFFIIFAVSPFAAAIAARLVLGEKLDAATLLAALAGFIGIAVMMFGSAGGVGALGDYLALLVVVTYCVLILIMRSFPRIDIIPLAAWTTLASGVLALPFAHFPALSQHQAGLLVLFGFIQLAGGNLLIFNAMRRISAAQSGLLGIMNAAFAPLWVFAVLGEVPAPRVLVGGAIILGAALLHLAWTLTRRPA